MLWVEIGNQVLLSLWLLSRERTEALGCTDTDDDKPAQCVTTKACRQIYQMIKAVSQGSNILSPGYIPILYDIVNPQAVSETQLGHWRAETKLSVHCFVERSPSSKIKIMLDDI